MREFNSREKNIIRKLADNEIGNLATLGRFLHENIYSIDNGTALVFIPEQHTVILYIKKSFSDAKKKVKIAEFLELISLI